MRKIVAICAVLALLVIAFWAGQTNGVKSRSKLQTEHDLKLHKELVELDRSFLTNIVTRPNTMTSGFYTLEVRFAGKAGQVTENELEFSNGQLNRMSKLPVVQTGNVVSWEQGNMEDEEGPSARFVGLIDGNVMWGRVYVKPGQGWREGDPPVYGDWRLLPKSDK